MIVHGWPVSRRKMICRMTTLFHSIYSSTATTSFKEYQIPALLEQARGNNAQNSITGVLLYIEGSFFQVLEGAEKDVTAVYESICRDPRHERVTQIIREPVVHRSFADWTMGFSTLDRIEAGQMIGDDDFFSDGGAALTRLGSGRAKKLLHAFLDGRWRTENTGMFRTPGRVA